MTDATEEYHALHLKIESLSQELKTVQNSLLNDFRNETKEIKTQLKHDEELVNERLASLRGQWTLFLSLLGVVGSVIVFLNVAIWSDTKNHGGNLTELTGRMGRVEGVLSSIQPTAATLAQTAAELNKVASSLAEASQPVIALDEHMKGMIDRFEISSRQLSDRIEVFSEVLKNRLPGTGSPPAASEQGAPQNP
jgi:hypothetical protein